MVVFGAGASFDCTPGWEAIGTPKAANYRPPLAKELFSDRANFGEAVDLYPDCAPIVAEMRVLGDDRTVEAKLQEFAAESDFDSRRPVQLAAVRYYLRRIISECGQKTHERLHTVTNYVHLVDQIENHRARRDHAPAIYATFNYDTLLDHALSRPSGASLADPLSYVSTGDTCLLEASWVSELGASTQAERGSSLDCDERHRERFNCPVRKGVPPCGGT